MEREKLLSSFALIFLNEDSIFFFCTLKEAIVQCVHVYAYGLRCLNLRCLSHINEYLNRRDKMARDNKFGCFERGLYSRKEFQLLDNPLIRTDYRKTGSLGATLSV